MTRRIETWRQTAPGVKKGDDVTLSEALNFGIDGNVQTITAAAAINLDANHVKVTGPTTSTYAITLGVPRRGGQVLVIEMTGTTGTNAVTLALANAVGGTAATTATFDAAGEILVLASAGAKWVVLKQQGVTLS
jgi:hypothetical protein